MPKCILCSNKATVNVQNNASRTIYNCRSCGVFVVSDLVVEDVKKYSNELASYFTSRKLAGHNEVVLVSFEKANKDKDYIQLTVKQILDQYPRSFTRTTDLILRNLALLSSYAGEEIKVENLEMCPIFYVRQQNYDALSFLIKSMQKFDLLEVNYYGSSFFPCGVIISPKGWDRLSEIDEGRVNQNTALVFLSGKESETGEAFRRVTRKTVKECGYEAVEMGQPDRSGERINFEVIAAVKNAKFTICGMENATGSAYYVAAMSRALGKPTILTCYEPLAGGLELDTRQISVLSWKDEKELYLQISNAIRALVD